MAAPRRRSAVDPLPVGERVELSGRGVTYVRRLAGPPGAPTVVLLHGLTGTADLTWTPSYRDLVRFFSVVAPDLRATVAVSAFSSRPWIEEVNVPAAVVLTQEDRVVPPHRQLELARLLPRAGLHEVWAGHGACLNATGRFLPALLAACREVAQAGAP